MFMFIYVCAIVFAVLFFFAVTLWNLHVERRYVEIAKQKGFTPGTMECEKFIDDLRRETEEKWSKSSKGL